MTQQEIEELTKVLEKTFLDRYDNALERFGNLKALYRRAECENNTLARRVDSLTTSNKKLTNKLARANESLEYYKKTTVFQNNVINRAREISPQVCTLINDILNEEYARSQTNK